MPALSRLCLILLIACATAKAEPTASQAPAPSADLKNIQQAIEAARSDLRQKQAARQAIDRTIQKNRATLAKAQRELADVTRRQRSAWKKLNTLQNELGRLKTEIEGTKTQVARLMASHYKNKQANAVVLFLKNAEIGQKSRYLEYTRYINQANQEAINRLAKQQTELAEQERKVNAELARLNHLKKQKQAALTAISRSDRNATAESRKLSAQIDSQTQKIAKLKANEQQLNRLIANLAAQEAKRKKADAAARKKAAEARLAAAKKAAKESKSNQKSKQNTQPKHTNKSNNTKPANTKSQTAKINPTPRSTLTAEDRALQAPDTVNTPSSGFSNMQGRLKRPIGGSLSGRFGQTRESGGTWRGVFFSTPPAAVKSIYSGKVAYAGSLSGYGNVVVVDHGQNYVSVYAGLSSLAVSSGAVINTGKILGSSGRLPAGEQGLYLEIRYRSQPMNPLSWIH